MPDKPSGKAPSAAALRILVAMSEGAELQILSNCFGLWRESPYLDETASTSAVLRLGDYGHIERLQDGKHTNLLVPTDTGRQWAAWAKAERGGE